MAIKRINLALQGGGAHGAFTWGVLDRLLQEEDLEFSGISGTSAGAMNAVVLVNGFMEGGRKGAREALKCFWESISQIGYPFNQIEQWNPGWNLDSSFAYTLFDMYSRFLSPYAVNPFNLNPLRDVLQQHLNLDTIRSCSRIQLFIAATHVESGQARIFQCDEISIDAILASACIPFLFQAVEIDGEPYWDGGYMGNPVLWPLIYNTPVEDILLVQINPLYRKGTPMRAADIINRMNEINFNSSLIAEMRAIQFVSKLHEENRLDKKKYKDVHMHLVEMEHTDINASSKMNTRWDFFQFLMEKGRHKAEHWLKHHRHQIGKESSVDIAAQFLNPKPTKS